ncbi:MAG: protein kinase [Deltaproteobacteria bacterium]|nr:protein kinase [Deltaproteobacteria bacterium]
MKLCPTCRSEYDDSASYCPEDGGLLTSTTDPLIGRTIANRYRIMQKIGIGGMSAVYLARHALIDRFNAIKFLRRDLAAEQVHRDRFLREAKAVNRINHPNIVEITDYGETEDGLVYLVMEYVPGDALATVMAKGTLPALRAIQICQQIAGALGRAHQMGVIHRDLKPENILLVGKEEGRDVIKILDFGVAKLVDAPTITGTDQVFGTPGYIAPEMVAGEPMDGRSDLYGLGVMLYEMICGALPYDWKYPGDLLVKRLSEDPVPPTERDPTFPRALEKVVLKALSRQPSARHRDAFHMLEELEAVLQELPRAGDAWSWGGAQPPVSGDATTAELPEVDRESWEGAQRDTPVSLPPLAHLVPAPLVPSRDGINAAAWWRFRMDALRVILEEFPVPGEVPSHVATAMTRIDAAIAELGGFEKRAQAAFARIEELETQGRQFRLDFGRAIDDLARQVSARRGEVETLANRREELRGKRDILETSRRRGGAVDDSALETIVWEFAAVEERLEAAGAEADDQEYQLSELRAKLGRRNEKLDRALAVTRSELEALANAADGLAAQLSEPFKTILAHASQAAGASERLRELERMAG